MGGDSHVGIPSDCRLDTSSQPLQLPKDHLTAILASHHESPILTRKVHYINNHIDTIMADSLASAKPLTTAHNST